MLPFIQAANRGVCLYRMILTQLRYILFNRFEGEKKELLQRKLKLSKDNDEKKAKLDELEKQLDQFVIVSLFLQRPVSVGSSTSHH